MVGWPALVSEVAWLEASAFTVFGLPAVTWAVLTAGAIGIRTAGAIGIRTVTTVELQVQSPSGPVRTMILAALLGGVGAVYLVVAEGWSALWVTIS